MIQIGLAPILLLLMTFSAGAGESVSKTLASAQAALRRGEPALAEKLLSPLVASGRVTDMSSADRAEVLAVWGDVLLAREDPERALRAFEEARRAASGEVRAELTLRAAECSLSVGDPEGARRLLSSLGEADRERPRVSFLSALVLYATDEREKARLQFEALLAGGPSAEVAHYLGVLAYERGALEEALKRFSSAIELDSGDYYSAVYRCRCLLDLHRAEEAERELRELKASRPTPEVSCLLGRALLRQGRDRDALLAFREAIRRQPSYAEALFGEASALRKLGEAEKAREATERFRRVHVRQQRDRRRLEALEQMSLRRPHEWTVRRDMAEISRSSGDLEAAERHAWKAVRLAPGEASCRLLLARILVDQGRYQAAAVQYQRILRGDAGHEEARVELERLIREHARSER